MAEPYKSCRTCRDAEGRKLLRQCPRLREKTHGAWYVRLHLEREGARYQPERGPFATRREALETAAAERTDRRRGTHVERTRARVGEYLWDWFDGRVNLRPSTRRSYEMHLRVHLAGPRGRWRGIGALHLADLSTDDVQRLYGKLRGGGLSPTSIRRVHATLSAALNAAVKRRLLPFNPAAFAELEPSPRPRVEPWTPEELGAFLDAAAADRLGVLYELITIAGLRRGEALGLRWCDVDVTTGALQIRQQIVDVGGRPVVGRPKTESGERRVDVDGATVADLRGWSELQAEEASRWGVAYADWRASFPGQALPASCRLPQCSHRLVFTREDGQPLRPEYVTRHLLVLARRAGLPAKRLHDLRHASASLQLAAGVPVAVVSKRLGHSQLSLTVDTYSHLYRAASVEAAERAAALVPRRRGLGRLSGASDGRPAGGG
jgi:integrase